MGFLVQYDAIPDTDVQARLQLFYQWLRNDWRSLFAELRRVRPILRTPAFAVVTRWADVIDLLSRHQTFTVEPYRPKMDPSVGPVMLARDGTEINWHEKSIMRSLLRWDDLPAVRRVAGEATLEGLAEADGTLELVSAVRCRAPLRVVHRYFGFPGPDDVTMLQLVQGHAVGHVSQSHQ